MTVINSYDKPAGEIREGNYLFGVKVLGVEPKRVNTTIRLKEPVDGRTAWQFRLTDMLEVGVEELTPEEVEERRLEHEAEEWEYFAKALRGLFPAAQAAVEAARVKRAERTENGWGLLDHYSFEAELEAAAEYDICREINHVWERFDAGQIHKHADDAKCEYTEKTPDGYRCVLPNVPMSEREIAERIYRSQLKHLLKSAVDRRVRSRSTNAISNLCEDLKEEARGSIINSLRWKTPRSLRVEFNADYDF